MCDFVKVEQLKQLILVDYILNPMKTQGKMLITLHKEQVVSGKHDRNISFTLSKRTF